MIRSILSSLLSLALLALPAEAALRYPTHVISIAANGTTAGTCEDGITSAAVSTTTSGTVGIDISGTWTGTLVFYTRTGAGGYVSNATAYPLGSTTAVASTTANGQWQIPVSGATGMCVAFSTASQTGTAVVQLNSTPAALFEPSTGGGGGGSGGGTVTQGPAGTAAAAWYTKNTDGTNVAAVKAASTAAVATDPALVVAISPNNGLVLGAGTAIAGKFGIDQTTPGTTNGVVVTTALPAGTNIIGSAKVTDGTNTSAVKAASTAPVATDPALVVTTSPNSGVAQGAASSGVNQTLSGCLTAASVSYSNNTINPCYQDANGNLQVKVTNLLSTGVNVAQVNGSSVTVTGTAGEQKVGVEGLGTAGSASGGVLTVQGSASGTAIPVSTTAQGTVTAGTAAANSLLAGAVYTSTEIAPTTSQGFALQGDANAHLRMTERYATAGQCQASAVSAATQCVGLSGASLKYYVTGIDVSDSVAATWTITSSTTAGNACATSPTTVWGGHYFPANGGGSPNIGTQPISVTANSALCCTPSAGPGTCSIRYYIAP